MTGFLDCRACVERASDLVSGDLHGHARLVCRVHIFLCKDCREHIRQLETTVRIVNDAPPASGLDADRKRALLEALRATK